VEVTGRADFTGGALAGTSFDEIRRTVYRLLGR
jgi:hypothetical protein